MATSSSSGTRLTVTVTPKSTSQATPSFSSTLPTSSSAQSSAQSSSSVQATSETQLSSSEGYRVKTLTAIVTQPTTTVVEPTSLPAVVVVPTSLPPAAPYEDYEAAYKADKMYKRDATTINVAVGQTTVSNSPKLTLLPKLSPKPTSSKSSLITDAPKPTSAPTLKPSSKSSSKPADGDEVNTAVMSEDPRCPYPYPGIQCGKPTTTVSTVTKPTSTSKVPDAKKTGSVAWCPYPYPGGRGEACP